MGFLILATLASSPVLTICVTVLIIYALKGLGSLAQGDRYDPKPSEHKDADDETDWKGPKKGKFFL